MRRREAFRSIRHVIGEEICPLISDVQSRVIDPEDVDRLDVARVRTHNLRQALAALVELYTEPNAARCPQCKHRDGHNAKCLVGRILAGETG